MYAECHVRYLGAVLGGRTLFSDVHEQVVRHGLRGSAIEKLVAAWDDLSSITSVATIIILVGLPPLVEVAALVLILVQVAGCYVRATGYEGQGEQELFRLGGGLMRKLTMMGNTANIFTSCINDVSGSVVLAASLKTLERS